MQLSENVVNFLKANGIDLNSSESQRATKLQQFIDGELTEGSNTSGEYEEILTEAMNAKARHPEDWARDEINAILVDQMAEAIENYVERFKTI